MTALRTMPVELLLEGRLAVCLGACDEVAYKVDRLLGAGAIVRVVEARAIAPSILAHEAGGSVTIERREPTDSDAEGAAIVFVSPHHEALGARLAGAARGEGRLVCTLDRPHAATFVNPAVAGTGPLRLSIASGGRSPALVRKVREGLEKALASPRLTAFVERVAAIRAAASPADRARKGRESVEGFEVDLVVRYPAWFDEDGPRDGGGGAAGTGAGPGVGTGEAT